MDIVPDPQPLYIGLTHHLAPVEMWNQPIQLRESVVLPASLGPVITRTVVLGKAPETAVKLFNIVYDAQAKAIKTAGPSVPAENVDHSARAVISAHGFGEYFIHRTGHGLGLEVHEEPNIKAGNTSPLEPGMVFTVEPGIYLPGTMGVRIEDNLIVTPSGVENTTVGLPKTISIRDFI